MAKSTITTITELVTANPQAPVWKLSFSHQIDPDATEWRVSHDQFGEIRGVGIVQWSEAGVNAWGQPVWSEGPKDAQGRRKPGAVIVPYRKAADGITWEVGLLWRFRPVPADPETGRQGMWFLEFPRGFADMTDTAAVETALREFSEEMQEPPRPPELLAWINGNTALFTERIGVWSVKLTDAGLLPQGSDLSLPTRGALVKQLQRRVVPPDQTEAKGHTVWIRFPELPRQLEAGGVVCNLTLGASAAFLARSGLILGNPPSQVRHRRFAQVLAGLMDEQAKSVSDLARIMAGYEAERSVRVKGAVLKALNATLDDWYTRYSGVTDRAAKELRNRIAYAVAGDPETEAARTAATLERRIGQWLNGSRLPWPDSLELLANALEVSLEVLQRAVDEERKARTS